MTVSSSPQESNPNRSKLIAAAAFAVVAIALVLAVVLSGSGDDETAAVAEVGTPTVTGNPLPEVPNSNVGDAASDPAYGLPIPEVRGQDFAGEPVDILRNGNAKALLFVSHGCPHCQDELPEVQSWLNETGGVAGVEIIAVSTSARQVSGNWPPSEWFARENWTSPVIADDEELSVFFGYGGTVIPYWVFVDADGNVTRRISGRLDVSLLELAMLEALTS
ncbi:MAG: TlpA disulfide reductase family protein [Acidimicrobiia bacterium]|nr:TlpA disulfide reductase family protein [Acidimicrobiia bacterium]